MKKLLLLFMLLISINGCKKGGADPEPLLNTFAGITISVAGGTFNMGSPIGIGGDGERPIHSVTVNSFNISKYEITNQQYVDFMNAIDANDNGSVADKEYLDMASIYIQIHHNGSSFVVYTGKENYPVIEVTWHGAKAYSEYYGGRLPTEAEWEFAALGGNDSNGYTYSGSNTLNDVAWFEDNSTNPDHPIVVGKGTHEVGTKNANELGIHDMSGNVEEWTNDWYNSTYYHNSPSNNPQGEMIGSSRANRGGNWFQHDSYCRVSYRHSNYPTTGDITLGFRPVFIP